jgi:hypothetical protein
VKQLNNGNWLPRRRRTNYSTSCSISGQFT